MARLTLALLAAQVAAQDAANAKSFAVIDARVKKLETIPVSPPSPVIVPPVPPSPPPAPLPVAPVAAFQATVTGLSVAFDASASKGDIVMWAWNFGGGQASNPGKTALATFPHNSDRTILLTVTDSAGKTASVTGIITVGGSVPTFYTFPASGPTAPIVIPSPPPSGDIGWPNDPMELGTSGASILNRYDFADPVPVGPDDAYIGSGGWKVLNSSGLATRVFTPGPVSPTAMQYRFPVGFGDGGSPCTSYFPTANFFKSYLAVKMRIMTPWEWAGDGNGVKILYNASNTTNGYPSAAMFLVAHHGTTVGGPDNSGVMQAQVEAPVGPLGEVFSNRDYDANVPGKNALFTLGEWFTLEYYQDVSLCDGVTANSKLRVYIEGQLVISFDDIYLPATSFFGEPRIYNSFGSPTVHKSEEDYIQYNAVRLTKVT